MIRRLHRLWRNLLVGIGLLLIPLGLVGAVLPTHLLGGLLVLGLILVLRNSIRWRRRFIRLQRRFPRYGHPVRRLLKGEVLPVVWHELLRTERVTARVVVWCARKLLSPWRGSARLRAAFKPSRLHMLRKARAQLRRRRRPG